MTQDAAVTELMELVESVINSPDQTKGSELALQEPAPASLWSKELYPMTIYDVLRILAFLRDTGVEIGSRFTTLIELTEDPQRTMDIDRLSTKGQPTEELTALIFGYEKNDNLLVNKDINLAKELISKNASLIVGHGKNSFLTGYAIKRLRKWLSSAAIKYNDPLAASRIEEAVKLLEEHGYSIIKPDEKSNANIVSEPRLPLASKSEKLKTFRLRHQIITKILSDEPGDIHYKKVADRHNRLSMVKRNHLQSTEGTHVNVGGVLEPVYKYNGHYYPSYMLSYIFDISPNTTQQIIEAKNINPGDDVTRSFDDFHKMFNEDEIEHLNECALYLYKVASALKSTDIQVTHVGRNKNIRVFNFNKNFTYQDCEYSIDEIAEILQQSTAKIYSKIRGYKPGADITPVIDKKYYFRGEPYTLEHLSALTGLAKNEIKASAANIRYGADITSIVNSLIAVQRESK